MTMAHEGILASALELSERMLEAARSGEWSTVTTLQSECDALIRQEHPADESTRVALLKLERGHRSLAELADQARDAVAVELGQLRRNRRALHAYLAPAGER